jgi:hypothetical protein
VGKRPPCVGHDQHLGHRGVIGTQASLLQGFHAESS